MLQPLDNFDSTLVANTSLLVTRQEPMSALEFGDYYERVEFQDLLGAADWTDYSATSTIVGWSSFTTRRIYYKRVGNTVFVAFYLIGTSNNATTTFTLPYISSTSLTLVYRLGGAQDNGVGIDTGSGALDSNSNLAYFIPVSGGSFTASGTKYISGQFFYDI